MPEVNAAIPPAPAAAGAPAPVVPTKTDDRLPEGTKVVNTMQADIDKFFDEPTPSPAAALPAVVPVAAPAAPAVGSVAARLAAKAKPASAIPPVPAPAGAPAADDPVATIEAEMRAHNRNWKPAEGWEKLKTTLRTESERRTALERELSETKTKIAATPIVAGMTADEIEQLKSREKSASDRLMVMDLENHPSFKAQFVEPKNLAIASAQELLAANGVKVDVHTLLMKPRAELGKAVVEAIKDLPEFDRVEVAEHIRKAYAIDQAAKGALGQSKELGKALQAKSVERQRAAFANRWAPVSAAIGEYVQPVETPADATPEQRAADEAYNADLSSLRTKAESIALSPTSDEAIAENSIKAAAYDLHVNRVLPRVVSEYEQVVELNRKLVAELNAIRGRNPNRQIAGTPTGGDTPVTDPAKMDHAHAADHYFNKG